ncbi:MAG: hypothetical protein IKY43_03840 [Bacteroidales bacterium]|jgi:RPA family protein|nr:hypothetical protein [Bacteroidales bacterium]
MFGFETTLSGIDFKVRKLIERCHATEREMVEEKQKNQELLKTIEEQKETIKSLEEQNKILKLRNTLEATKGDSAEVKLKINQLIREIDRSIDLLTKM